MFRTVATQTALNSRSTGGGRSESGTFCAPARAGQATDSKRETASRITPETNPLGQAISACLPRYPHSYIPP